MKNENIKVGIWTSVIGALAVIIVAFIQFYPWTNKSKTDQPDEKLYVIAGSVIDEKTNENIGQAEITLIGRNEHFYTEENGNFRIKIKDSVESVRLRVTKEHFLPFDKSYNVPEENIIIQLKVDAHKL